MKRQATCLFLIPCLRNVFPTVEGSFVTLAVTAGDTFLNSRATLTRRAASAIENGKDHTDERMGCKPYKRLFLALRRHCDGESGNTF